MNLRILPAIEKYASRRSTRLHMPGHKGNKKFCKLFKGADLDVTELPVIDNENVLSLAESDVAKLLGSRRTWFLTNGSSSGVHIAVYAVRKRGRKLLVGRGSHKSIYAALEICGIHPVIINDFSGNESFYDDISQSLDDDVIGALLTYPDYYGRTFDIKRVGEILHSKKKLLLIDNAHGGHFRFLSDGAIYAGDVADVWVDGLHKTFPTLNQGAILNTSNSELIVDLEDGINKFLTTSPSYPLLASIEYGIKYLAENRQETAKREQALFELKKKINVLGLVAEDGSDPFKIYIPFTKFGIEPKEAGEILEKENIFFEMNDNRGILFMFSVLNTDDDVRKLYSALKKISLIHRKEIKTKKIDVIPEKKLSYLDAVSSDKEWVDVKNAEGRISAINIGNFPPCKPIILAGEVITKEAIDLIDAKFSFGIRDGKVAVVKEDK